MYDKEKAALYGEVFWCRRNPAYPAFKYDGGNFISQCLLAGGLLMEDTGDSESGWWYRAQEGTYSASWVEPDALYWYLHSPLFTSILREPQEAASLERGDLIFYDFNGDGPYQHVAIVTALDDSGMPLVCSHSRNFYQHGWAYWEKGETTRYVFCHFV